MAPVLEEWASGAASLPHEAVRDAMYVLAQLRGQVDAVLASFTHVFDANALGSVEGARTTRAWGTSRTELRGNDITAALRRGRALLDCPHLASAFAAGRLGTAKIDACLAARVELEDRFAEAEADLVNRLAPLTAAGARRVMAAWRTAAAMLEGLDLDAPADDGDANRLHLSETFGGRWRLDADLDQITGTEIHTALENLLDRDFQSGALNATDQVSRSKLLADALAELVTAGATGGTRNGRPRPSVHINVDHKALLGEHADTLVEALWGWRHQSSTGTPVDLSTIHHLLCNADVTEILTRYNLDGTTDPLGVTHTRRYPTRSERDALDQRDQGCVYPGCDTPPNRTEAHHTVPYEIGGYTRLDELVLLCRYHHHLIHQPGHRLTRDPGTGRITTTLPDGLRQPHTPWQHKVERPPPDTG